MASSHSHANPNDLVSTYGSRPSSRWDLDWLKTRADRVRKRISIPVAILVGCVAGMYISSFVDGTLLPAETPKPNNMIEVPEQYRSSVEHFRDSLMEKDIESKSMPSGT